MIFKVVSSFFKKAAQILLLVILGCLSFAGQVESSITAKINPDKESYTRPCPTVIDFKGTIASDRLGKVQYRLKSSDGTLFPIETLEFSGPGTKVVKAKQTVGNSTNLTYSGWMSLQVLYPEEVESDKAKFSVSCVPAAMDLTVKIRECPKAARPGQDLGNTFKVKTINNGTTDVNNILLDLVLSKNRSCPVPTPLAEYSPNFHDRVLLKGGRQQISLKAAHREVVSLAGSNTIPADTPNGDYFLCAIIDAGDKIKEVDEENNCDCCAIKVSSSAGVPDLIIESFHFKGWGKCEPDQPIFYFEITIANIGTAASPALTNKAVIEVVDLPRNDWGNRVGLSAIPPGGHLTIEIPVYYFTKDPSHMTTAVPHPFRAILDPYHLINEPKDKNRMSDIIYLDPSPVCSKDGKNY